MSSWGDHGSEWAPTTTPFPSPLSRTALSLWSFGAPFPSHRFPCTFSWLCSPIPIVSYLSLGPAFIGQVNLERGSEGDDIKLSVTLFKKVSGKLLYKFEVVKGIDYTLTIESTLYASDGVSIDKTICFGDSELSYNDLYDCISILNDTDYKDTLIELITRSGF